MAQKRPRSRSMPRKQVSQAEELAERLREWAVREMGFQKGREEMFSPEDFKMLFSGSMAGMWEYIVGRVRSPRTAEMVRRNLLLYSGGVASLGTKLGDRAERDVLLEQRAQLSQELRSLRLAVTQMDSDIGRTREDIAHIAENNEATRAELAELSRKTALLSSHSVKSQETVQILREFSQRIRQRMELFRHTASEPSYFARSGPHPAQCSDGSRAVVLEAACTREVRGVCGLVEKLVRLLERGGQRSEEVERTREQVWSKIESLLSLHPPHEILSSLTEVTHQAATKLHTQTASIDLKKDARQLKYCCDQSGQMRDVSTKQSLLHTVEEHLLEAQLAHIRRSLESERAQKTAREAQQRLLEVKGRAEQLLVVQYQGDPQGLELMRARLGLELEEEGCASALEALCSFCGSLGTARDRRKTALGQLQHKHARIQEFTHIAESRQAHIQALVKHNSTAKDGLLRQKPELELYKRQHVCGHETPLVVLASGLMDGALHEVKLFSNLSLAKMMRPPGLDTSLCDLSINRLGNCQPSGHPSWEPVLKALNISSYTAPNRVLLKAVEMIQEVAHLKEEVRESEKLLEEMRSRAPDRKKAMAVLTAAQQHEKWLLEEAVPSLTHCLSHASQGLADCAKVQQTLEEWWDQPAQYLVPWVTQEGMNEGKWVEQWRVLAAKMRQLSTR